MRQCERCKFYVPDDAQFCANCGNSLIASPTVTSTMPSQPPGRPPEASRQRRYTYFIPGFGAFGLFRRDSVTGQRGCAPGCLITSILVAVLSLGGFLFLHNSSSQASLSVDHAVPGGTMHVHGSNFPPGARVKIAVDENTAASYTLALAVVGNSTFHNQLLAPTDAIVIVQIDGTFDAMLPVPATWTPGSHHIIRATTQNAQAAAQANTDVETEAPGKPTPTPAPPKRHHAPALAGISPANGPTTGGTIVIVNGKGFSNVFGIFFGTTSGIDARVLSDSQISVVSPAGSGTVDLEVTTPYGTSKTSSADRFTYTPSNPLPPAQPPVVSRLNPARGSSDGGTTVTITGSNFKDATGVSFGSLAAASFRVVSDTQITAVNTAGRGAVDVTVTTPQGTSKTGNQFTYVVPLPVVKSIGPMSGSMDGGDTVVISGTDFTGATLVSFDIATVPCDAENKCSVDSNTQITVKSPPQDPSDPSNPVDVTVKTSAGTSATSSVDRFTYVASPPAVTSISPRHGSTKGGDAVTIIGTHFTGATQVAFGKATVNCGSDSNCTVGSDRQITVTSPPQEPSDTSRPVDVTVTTPDGTSATSGADQFTYTIPLPVITSISSASGSAAGGDPVIITGKNFTTVTSVEFGKRIFTCRTASSDYILQNWYWVQNIFNERFKRFYNPLDKNSQRSGGSCTVDSDTQITVISPAEDPSESSDLVDVTVKTSDGTSATSSADQFTYLPVVDSISPARGPVTGGTSVTINGAGFVHASKVAFGSAVIDCSVSGNCTISSDGTQITVQSPQESLSDESQPNVDVTVTNAAGDTSPVGRADKFTYTANIT